ncbi:hypothetical protein DFS33DRAFT_1455307 [Desarmillaria ectypa]|nr:hypothetical protein DFS33DRAFT_1455307 [Desarmillaria ectypa]
MECILTRNVITIQFSRRFRSVSLQYRPTNLNVQYVAFFGAALARSGTSVIACISGQDFRPSPLFVATIATITSFTVFSLLDLARRSQRYSYTMGAVLLLRLGSYVRASTSPTTPVNALIEGFRLPEDVYVTTCEIKHVSFTTKLDLNDELLVRRRNVYNDSGKAFTSNGEFYLSLPSFVPQVFWSLGIGIQLESIAYTKARKTCTIIIIIISYFLFVELWSTQFGLSPANYFFDERLCSVIQLTSRMSDGTQILVIKGDNGKTLTLPRSFILNWREEHLDSHMHNRTA